MIRRIVALSNGSVECMVQRLSHVRPYVTIEINRVASFLSGYPVLQSRQYGNTGIGDPTMSDMIYGGCLCGAVRYECRHALAPIVVCHCRDCQKASGSDAAYNARVPASAVTFTRGTPQTYTVIADSGEKLKRMFCSACGSQLFSQRERLPQFMTIKVGSLDTLDGLELGRHIWTGSAAPWATFYETLPQHEGEFAGLRAPGAAPAEGCIPPSSRQP